ncbi:MAG: beta-ketoacyl synthase N-terminal-like domain-containing protein [Syntrophobacteraceae bacterium]|nr:beta-ketoacyl synthase N-terminal-like domain-containing protein [Syntrophobacteraceae bacterium]
MSSSRRVVVTGMGLVTPLGKGVEANWKNVLAAKTGIKRCVRPDAPEHYQFYGRVEGVERPEGVPPSLAGQVRFLNRGSVLGFEAAMEAVKNSRIDPASVPGERRSLFLASGDLTKTGCEFMHPALKDATKNRGKGVDRLALNKSLINKVNPFFLLESISNNLFSFLTAALEFMGPNTSLASFSPSGAHALELACRRIGQGEADIALAVGCCCWITEIPMYELDGLGILSRCKHGPASFRPLDRARDGFIPAEGGAAILVEDRDLAMARGANILAEINGNGNCIEPPAGKSLSVPDEVSKNCIRQALREASVDVGDLAFLCPHGSGTRKGDRSELKSIQTIFEAEGRSAPVCALKAYTGHMGAASDICEVILGIEAINAGLVPGTLNFSMAEPAFEGLDISASTRKAAGKSFVSVSYGIMGQCSSVLVEGRAN